MRGLLNDFFRSQGYGVGCAPGAEEALARLSDEADFAAVVCDIRMAPIDGIELLRAIKSRRPSLPVLLFTAAGNLSERKQALELGAYDYLLKPFSLTELKRVLEDAIAAN